MHASRCSPSSWYSTIRFSGRAPLACLLSVALFFQSACPSQAQSPQADSTLDSVVKLTPDDAIAAFTIRPQRIAAGERLNLAPLEVVTAAGLEHVGIDPLKIVRVDVLIGFPGLDGEQLGAVIQLAEPFDINHLNPQMVDGNGLQTDGTFEYLSAPEQELIYHQAGPSTIIFGTRIFAKQMVAPRQQLGKVASLLQQVKAESDVLAIVSIDMLRPLIEEVDYRPLGQLPQSLAQDVQAILESTEFVAVGANFASEAKLQLVMAGATAAETDKIEAALRRSLEFFRETYSAQVQQQFSGPTETEVAVRSYVDRVKEALAGQLMPVRQGDKLVLDVQQLQSVAAIGTLSFLIAPAVEAARRASLRMESSNNLRQIGLAFHNFESAYRTLPAASGLDNDGKPMLSWRVALLPFLDEAALYEEFHLDEPWDSEHNITLLERMPAVFRHPSKKTQPGYTVFQVPLSDESLLRQTEATKFGDITDGLSNTILALETSAEAAVPWTAPQDYQIDNDNPGAKLFTNGKTSIVLGDGYVRSISHSIAAEILNALYTRGGGELIPEY